METSRCKEAAGAAGSAAGDGWAGALRPPASADEAAAIIAAVEQFLHDTALPPAPARPCLSAWKRAALQEGVARRPEPSA